MVRIPIELRSQFEKTLIRDKWLTAEELKTLMQRPHPLERLLLAQGVLSEDQIEKIIKTLTPTLENPERNKSSSQELDFINSPTLIAQTPEFDSQKQHFEKYEVLEKLAQGGMGIVYKVRHIELEQIYALKVIIAGEGASPATIKRFHQEAKTTAKLRHPNIVQVVDSGQERGQHFFCMEFVEGETLESLIQNKKLTIRKGLKLIQKSLLALDYAHKEGVIHRDLKPANIFVTKKGEPKIGDFGLAKDSGGDAESHQLTQSGEVIGTPAYMPPEQASGETKKLEATADVYSIGACLYETLTGQCPFEGNTVHELFYKIVSEDPKAPSKINPDIHRDVDTIILKALEKSRTKRYRTAKSFAEDIECFLKGYPIKARPISNRERFLKWSKRNKQPILVGSIIVGLCLLFFLYHQWQLYQERNKNYLHYFKKAIAEQQIAEDIKDTNRNLKAKKIEHLLTTLNHLNSALSIKPEFLEVEERKLNVGQSLIQLACDTQEFALADHIARDLNRLTLIGSKMRTTIKDKIHQEKVKTSEQHQKEFNEWKEKLKTGTLEEGERDDAIFEISKMPEQKIYEALIQILKEGTKYFLASTKRTTKLDEYYQTMAEILGRLEDPKAGPLLYEALAELAAKYSKLPPEKHTEEMNFMKQVAQALGNAKNTNYADKLQNIRKKMGRGNLFWRETEKSYHKLTSPYPFTLNDPEFAETNIDQEKRSVKALYQQGLEKLKAKKTKEALAFFNKVLSSDPNFAEAYYKRATLKLMQQNFLGAIEDYNKMLQLVPNSAQAYNARGVAQIKINNEEEAIQDFTRALQHQPNLTDAMINRASTLSKLEKYQAALIDLKTVIKQDPKKASAYFIQAAIYKKQNQTTRSIEAMLKGLQIKKDLEKVQMLNNLLLFRCITHISKKEFLKAKADYKLIQKWAPPQVLPALQEKMYQTLLEMKTKCITTKEKKSAIEALEWAYELTPSPTLRKELLELLLKQCMRKIKAKKYKEAQTNLLRYKEYATPENPNLKRIEKLLKKIEKEISKK